jgi:hypothetical protein
MEEAGTSQDKTTKHNTIKHSIKQNSTATRKDKTGYHKNKR